MADLDVFDKSMGELGRYQIWIVFLLLLTKFPVGWHLLNIIIIGPTPVVNCTSPSNITNGCDVDCKTRYINPAPMEVTIHTQWEIVCEKRLYSTLAQMLMMAGVMLGSLIFGIWADKSGRKFPLLIACIAQAIFATTIAFVPSLWLFLTMRFLIGFATGGQMTCSFVLLMELIGKKWRVFIGTMYQIPTWFAHLSLALIGYIWRDWHHSQLFISIPSFIFISFYWLLPESPRYLLSIGKVDEAVEVMTVFAQRNKLPTDKIAGDVATYMIEAKKTKQEKGKFTDLFQPKVICLRTLILVVNWIAVGICFYGVAQYAGQRKGDLFSNIAISAAMEIPGTFVAVFMVGKAGRKLTTMLLCAISAAPMFVIPFLSGSLVVSTMALVAMFGLAGLFATVYVYSGELYPTFIRSIGVGFVSMTCRIGTITAPFIVSIGLYPNCEWVPPVIFGCFPVIGGALAYFLPETKNDKLADTLEDALNLGKKKNTDDRD